MVVSNVRVAYLETSSEIEPPSAEKRRLGVQEKRTASRNSCYESSPCSVRKAVFPFSTSNGIACANTRECSISTLAAVPLKTITFCQCTE